MIYNWKANLGYNLSFGVVEEDIEAESDGQDIIRVPGHQVQVVITDDIDCVKRTSANRFKATWTNWRSSEMIGDAKDMKAISKAIRNTGGPRLRFSE